jgi:transcriptional regulator with XRE-family HTH domain
MNEFSDAIKQGFRNKDYRHSYADEFLNETIATQIKTLREQRVWRQVDLAREAGMPQSMIARLENVNYSSWSINTLRKLARAFDVRLRVTFESFGSIIGEFESFSRQSLQRDQFDIDPVFHPHVEPYARLMEARVPETRERFGNMIPFAPGQALAGQKTQASPADVYLMSLAHRTQGGSANAALGGSAR